MTGAGDVLHRLLLVEVANYKVVTILGCLTLLLAARVTWRRRYRPVFAAIGVLTAVLAGADTVNTYFGYLPQVSDVLGVVDWHTVSVRQVLEVSSSQPLPSPTSALREGAIVSLPITGAASGFGRHNVLVALPPQYFTEPTRHFPVIYLLHGSPGRPQDWLRAARLLAVVHQPATATQPMIFVMPPMSRGWLDDSECVDGQRESVETWLVDDVVPQVDALLHTMPDRQHRGLAGMSAGGYCALNLAVRDSRLFGAALDMSGYTEPTFDGGLRHLFGPQWRAAAAQNTPGTFVANHRMTLPLHIRFDVGRADRRPLREIHRLIPLLNASGVATVVVTRGGGHTYHVWVPALRQGIDWFATVFGAAT